VVEDTNQVDEEDWTSYSSAGPSGESYNPWSELDNSQQEENDLESFDQIYDSEQHEEVLPAPSLSGIKHLIKIGACNFCLGRLGGLNSREGTFEERGLTIREQHEEKSEIKDGMNKHCPFCEDLFEDVEKISDMLVSELSEFEFTRLQLGAQFPSDLTEDEDMLRGKFGAPGSLPLKSTFVSEVAKSVSNKIKKVQIVNDAPDILALIDVVTFSIKLDNRSVFLYTRYRKLERGIPQTRWPCRACKGRSGGCENCNGSGLQYETSVQDLIGNPLLEIFGATDHSSHSMGREDIDVRCLGRGRPTVIEMKKPKKRNIDYEKSTKIVNSEANGLIEIETFRISNKAEVVRLKGSPSEKTYRICFKISSETEEIPNSDEVISKLSELSGVELEQRTPNRVSHRRADKIRRRKVVSLDDITVEGSEIEITIRAQAGTYIKELVTSDEGRTVPSISSVLGLNCEVMWLDVLEIHAD